MSQHNHSTFHTALTVSTASHAYLFSGPSGSAKQLAAQEFATKLITQSDDIDQHHQIQQRVSKDSHPDVTWLRPTGAAGILVEQVEQRITQTIFQTPLEGYRRVVIIEAAETIREQVASKLLKILEEPPAFVHFILLTDRISAVLPTILSRCQLVRFQTASCEDVTIQLKSENIRAEEATAITKLSKNDIDYARFLTSELGKKLRTASTSAARSLYQSNELYQPYLDQIIELSDLAAAEAVQAIDDEERTALQFASKREQASVKRDFAQQRKRLERLTRFQQIEHALNLIVFWFRDLAYLHYGREQAEQNKVDIARFLYHSDSILQLQSDVRKVNCTAADWWQATAIIEKTKRQLQLNVNLQLLLRAAAAEIKSEIMPV